MKAGSTTANAKSVEAHELAKDNLLELDESANGVGLYQ